MDNESVVFVSRRTMVAPHSPTVRAENGKMDTAKEINEEMVVKEIMEEGLKGE